MTDLLMFAAMFATFIVLRGSTFGGVGVADIASIPFVFAETMILLLSSYCIGLAVISAHRGSLKRAALSLSATFVLGAAFLGMEIYEFSRLVAEGHTPAKSAFLSAFFTLVGMHGLHILAGLIWIAIVFPMILRKGFTFRNIERLTLLSMFWHFLDLVWIFIFTIVYLMGVI
ncbi:MAG TPA: cytochrome c oxidase subunit 3, partial [Candidatus Paceibacterota bacterium]|nr:cytochrome c oxidase subunit 3 [Candidatus Paceibacterota bacterium]